MNATLLERKQSEMEWIERSWLMNIVLFLCFTNFLNEFFYLCLLALAVLVMRMFLNHTPMVVSKMFFAVLLFGIFFLIFGGSYFYKTNGINGLAKCFLYPICFFIGENIATGKREHCLHHVLYIITFAMSTHGALNFIKNFDALNNIGRNTYDIWTGQIWSATGQASLFVLLCGTAYYGIFLQEKKWIKLLVLIFSAIMLIYNTFFLAGRLVFVALILCVFVGIVLCLRGRKASLSLYNVRRKALLALIIFVVFLCLFSVFWHHDIFDLRTFIENSNFFERFSNSDMNDMLWDETRTDIQKEYIRLILVYPWGGNQIRQHIGVYGHNAFLSAINIAGIPAMFMVVVIFLGMLYQMWKFYRLNNISLTCRIWIISIYVASFSLMAYEPVFDSVPFFIGGILMISGMINALLKGA